MARIPLLCPIDGTTLGAANANITPTARGNVALDAGDHIHLIVMFDLTCANGHRWITEADIVLRRA